MGSIPQLSILKGPTRLLHLNQLNNLFEKIASGAAANQLALVYKGKMTKSLKMNFYN